MTEIFRKPVGGGQLPTDSIEVRAMTANGYTAAEENAILADEAEVEALPFRPAREVLTEIAAIVSREQREPQNKRQGTLADFLGSSPLRKSGLSVERSRDRPRDRKS